MDAKLRAYLKRSGISDEALDKIERGQIPADDDHALGKQTSDSPVLEKIRVVDDLLAEIKSRLDDIAKADEVRRSFARGLEMFNSGKVNGVAALSKGAAQ